MLDLNICLIEQADWVAYCSGAASFEPAISDVDGLSVETCCMLPLDLEETQRYGAKESKDAAGQVGTVKVNRRKIAGVIKVLPLLQLKNYENLIGELLLLKHPHIGAMP
ncbi:MAG: hypothetical protein HF981_03235 [Desulfobacteraceae bacterium]|nr:hypothetical protein [Desulfobacteraceae bacterium]MBC2749380.1 hypothetical protein [Desulfobacteraceae bacterium]